MARTAAESVEVIRTSPPRGSSRTRYVIFARRADMSRVPGTSRRCTNSGVLKSPFLNAAAISFRCALAALPAESRRRLSAHGAERAVAAGRPLFRAGQQPVGLWILLDGTVRVTSTVDGRRHVVHSEGLGGTLGEVPLFDGGAYPATASAVTACRCLLVPAAALAAAIESDPAPPRFFLARLAHRVREIVGRLDRATATGVSARVAEALP